MADKKIDFIVIGAAKAATTSLYELVKSHPEIYIPGSKEVPFFSDNKVYTKGMKRYLKNYFSSCDRKKLWGTVTPQYMLGQGEVSSQLIAERIHRELPNVKLIALLRNPAERAFSHYKMWVQRGYESREFEKIIRQTFEDPKAVRKNTKPEESYIFGSEYGRILSSYYSLFPEKNILVLTTEELRDQPAETVRQFCSFLDIDANFTPENINKKHRQGGARPKVKFLTPGFLFRIPYMEKAWKSLTPQPLRKRVEYFMNLWNSKPDNSKLDKNSKSYKSLLDFYANDIEELKRLTARDLPWA